MEKELIVDEPLITLHLCLTQAEMSSLLMAQIMQVRGSRLKFGLFDPLTCIDRAVLEKLVQQQMLPKKAG